MRTKDEEESKRLNAEIWQTDLLDLNPSYTCWGPHEDYMTDQNGGWSSPQIIETWQDFTWKLDDLNECVNFYFSVRRDSKECPSCGGNGYHKLAQEVVNTFYSHMNERGICWHDKITEDEVQALLKAGRLWDWTRNGKTPTASEVNAAQNQRGCGGHDAINRIILTKTRLARLGIPHECDECEGHGHVFTSPQAHVSLTLWMLHPRKGCSRGVEVTHIRQADLSQVFAWLKQARDRNTERFSKLP